MATRATLNNIAPAKYVVAPAGQLRQVGPSSNDVWKPSADVIGEKSFSGGGFTVHALRNLAHKSMSASGMVSDGLQPATFHFLQVNAPARSGALTINVRNGGPAGTILRTVTATAGATIDRTSSPDSAPGGLFFEVFGGPTRGLDVSVYYR